MRSSFVDMLPDLLELLVFGLGSAGLSLVGTYIKRFALVILEQDNVGIATWVVTMDAVALYFVYDVGTDKACPKLRSVHAAPVQRNRSLIPDVPASSKERMSWAVGQHVHAALSCVRSAR